MLKPLEDIRKIIEMIRPDFAGYMRFPVEGLVTAVDAENYTCEVQPLDAEMSLLPKCRILSLWGTPTRRLIFLPTVNSKVMVGFEDGDHTKPYIQGFFPDQGPGAMTMVLETEQARITIDVSGKIIVESDSDIEVTCVDCKIKASGNIDLGEGGAGVITSGPGGTLPACMVTGAPIPCSSTVKAKG
jgi:hypothetical protein